MSTIVNPERVGPFPFPKTSVEDRKNNFCEVQLSYTRMQAIEEAQRCLLCGTPVCMDICPVQTDVRGMCEAVARGDFKTAYERIRETNPLLGTTARCCPQIQTLCESACNLQWAGNPVAIGMIQRAVSDWERDEENQNEPSKYSETGKRVAVIGGGPAGLGAGELLRRYGHSVTIFEELGYLGGTAWYGIPDYHLPKDVLQYEIERIKDQGVQVKTGIRVGRDITLSTLLEDYDSVLIATGCKDVTGMDTPGSSLKGVYDGYSFLEDVFSNGIDSYLENPKYDLGNEILVIGGGNSAIDAARTALRLTGGNVTIVYRRTEREMPADPVVVEEAREEGVNFKFLAAPKSFNGTDGVLKDATMVTMELGAPDSSGRRSPQPVLGKDFEITCDSVILAVGRGPNSFLQTRSGIKSGKNSAIQIDEQCKTSVYRVFAAGDVVSGETLVVKALKSGREAAQRVHEYLMNLEEAHESLYSRYFTQRRYSRLFNDEKDGLPPA
ncbi:MAG: FAD-dependent oxidoreductase [Nitrososphaerota archaeon]|nr:FAD-dependent oxidoreductase [Nitrososphaerota archaeon]